jgi:hypothetical protein
MFVSIALLVSLRCTVHRSPGALEAGVHRPVRPSAGSSWYGHLTVALRASSRAARARPRGATHRTPGRGWPSAGRALAERWPRVALHPRAHGRRAGVDHAMPARGARSGVCLPGRALSLCAFGCERLRTERCVARTVGGGRAGLTKAAAAAFGTAFRGGPAGASLSGIITSPSLRGRSRHALVPDDDLVRVARIIVPASRQKENQNTGEAARERRSPGHRMTLMTHGFTTRPFCTRATIFTDLSAVDAFT